METLKTSASGDTDYTGWLRSVEKSQTLLLNEQSRLLEGEGKEVYKLGFGQSPFLPMESAMEALKSAAHRKEYSPVQGLPELRQAVAEFHRAAEGIAITPDRVLIAPGSKILLYAVMACFIRADVLIPAPSWVSYQPQAKLLGHTPIPVVTDYDGSWRVTPEAVERAVATKRDARVPTLMILNYPGNPDGLSYGKEQIEALAQVFRRHNILVIADEIYGLLDHRGRHKPLVSAYPEATITTGGLSKWCGAGGWRLGIAMLPQSLSGEFRDVLLGVCSETYSCAPVPVQVAAITAYQWNDETRNYLAHQRRLLACLGGWVADTLRQAGVKVYDPQGGFYLFPDFSAFAPKLAGRGIKTSQAFCAALLNDTGVALLPGDAFGMPPEDLTARLAYVEFDGAAALAASRRHGLERELDDAFRQQHFAKAERGITKLCDWLRAL